MRTILYLSLSGSLLAFLLMLMKSLLGTRLSSKVYYYAWILVLLRFVLPVQGLVPAGEERVAVEYVAQLQQSDEGNNIRTYRYVPEIANGGIFANLDEDTYEPMEAPTALPEENVQKKTFGLKEIMSFVAGSRSFWTFIWLSGVLIHAGYHVFGYMLFSARLRRTLSPVDDSELKQYIEIKLRSKPEISKSPLASTPMLLGLKEPLLVLPDRTYSRQRLEYILRHELTHYRRKDIVYKWCAVLVFSLHWFNPLGLLFLRELDRACELSCDEALISGMSPKEKQDYGETLLALAARSPINGRSFATGYAAEKRMLKERLEHIMKYRHKGKSGIALTMAFILLLSGCGLVMGPKTESVPMPSEPLPTPEAVSEGEQMVVQAETVDEFIAAIGPDRVIELTGREYVLSEAAFYGENTGNDYCTWTEVYDGYELQISGVDNMSIIGRGMVNSSIITTPRYADVLYFDSCSNIRLEAFTAGHTDEGMCSGGVLSFADSGNINVDSCELFGCGIEGIRAVNCRDLTAEYTVIRDCSLRAVYTEASKNILISDCEIYGCDDENGIEVFGVNSSWGFAVVNSLIHNNKANSLLSANFSQQLSILGCEIKNNSFGAGMFALIQYGAEVDGCLFENNSGDWYYPMKYGVCKALSSDAKELEAEDFQAMEHEETVFLGFAEQEPVDVESVQTGEMNEVYVTTVDEFLAAIAPNTRIYLEGECFDLSTASDYGAYGGDYYYWINEFDGPELCITGVENLAIIGLGKEKTEILAIPRYVDVLTFDRCRNISLSGFTAGHTEEGQCSGGVLMFNECDDIHICDCGLFGCGTWGIQAVDSNNMSAVDTEIYHCSVGGINLNGCSNMSFDNCDIHDVQGIEFNTHSCTGISIDGQLQPEDPMLVQMMEIRYFDEPKSEFALKVGDEPVELNAVIAPEIPDAKVDWFCSDNSVLKLTPSEDGRSCVVEIIGSIEGGVELTACCRNAEHTITVYCLP